MPVTANGGLRLATHGDENGRRRYVLACGGVVVNDPDFDFGVGGDGGLRKYRDCRREYDGDGEQYRETNLGAMLFSSAVSPRAALRAPRRVREDIGEAGAETSLGPASKSARATVRHPKPC